MLYFKPKFLLIFISIALLSSCATQKKQIKIDPTQNIPLNEINHWQLKARIAIKTPEDSVTASLNWQQNNKQFDFLVTGAFGATYAHLIQEKKLASLEIPDNEKRFHRDAEVLLQQSLGWNFPLSALSYWVKGLPSGHLNEQITYDNKGRVKEIHLNQWHITFSKYQLFQGYRVPKMIKAVHPNMTIKVVAKKWLFLQ